MRLARLQLVAADNSVDHRPESDRVASKNQPAVVPLALSNDGKTADETPRESFRHKVTFTASQRVRDLLTEAQDLLRNRIPDGDLEPIFEQALELLVAREKKRQFGHTDKPRAKPEAAPTEPSRYVANDVRREVYARDGGQCCFIGPDGQRCSARGRLEYDHEKPHAQAGLPA